MMMQTGLLPIKRSGINEDAKSAGGWMYNCTIHRSAARNTMSNRLMMTSTTNNLPNAARSFGVNESIVFLKIRFNVVSTVRPPKEGILKKILSKADH